MKKKRPGSTGQPRVEVSEPSLVQRFLPSPWFPVAIFALVSLVYFGEFIASDKIVYGVDVGADYHLGKGSVSEKLSELSQPLWNHDLGGYPEANGLRWRYFPTYVSYLFTTHHRHLGWRYICSLFLAGCGTFLFLRALPIGRLPSIWGGIAFMSAPAFLSFTLAGHHAKMMVIALFPHMCWALLCGMRKGQAAFFLVLATLIGIGIYTPHLQLLYYTLWGLGVLFLFLLYDQYKQSLPPPQIALRSGLFAVAVLLGLGLGSEGLWPSYLHAKTQSKRAVSDDGQARSSEDRLEFARSWSLHPEEAASLVVPEFGGFYDPQQNTEHYWGRNAFKLNSEYFGIVVLFLAGLFLPSIRRHRIAIAMATLFLLALCYTLGPHTPLHWIVFHLVPGASVLRTPGMAAFLFVFPACVLAAMALDRALDPGGGEGLDALSPRRIAITGGVLGGFAFLLGLAPDIVTGIWTKTLYADIDPAKRAVLAANVDWIGQGAMLAALICAAAAALLYWHTTRKTAAGLIVLALCVLTIGDGWRISRRFLRYEDPARQTDIRRENQSAVRFLRQQDFLGRVYQVPNYKLYDSAGYHLFDVPTVAGFHDFTIRRYDRVLRELAPVESMLSARYLEGQTVRYSTADLLASIRPLLNLLSVQYLVIPSAIDPAGWGFDKALASDRVSLVANDTAPPWCYAVTRHQVVEDESQLLQLLREGRVNLHTTVLLEQDPSVGEVSTSSDVHVELLERNADDGVFRFKVKATQPSWLVLSENFYPDWRARIDDEMTRIYRANYIWQAVRVEAGEHTVEFRFESDVLYWSRLASLASAVVLICGAVVLWGRRARTSSLATDESERAQD